MPRKPPVRPPAIIPGPELDKMITRYGPLCPINALARETGYSVYVIRKNFVRRGVRILGHAEIKQGGVDAVLDGTDAGPRYEAGEGATGLAEEFGVNTGSFCKWLQRRGIPVRGRSGNMEARFRGMSQEQRNAHAAAMHAVRAEVTPELLCLMAKGREGKPGPNFSAAHRALTQALRQAGYPVTLQKAAGRYNMPVAAPRAGFDLTTAGPEWAMRNRPDRIRAFLQDGLDVVTVCVPTLKFPVRPTQMVLIREHLAWRDANPGLAPVYLVITRGDKPLPFRTLDTIPDLPSMSARESRERARQERNAANSEDGIPPAGSSSH